MADAPSAEVALYVAEAPPGVEVVLDAEHDALRWVALEEAVASCLPAEVGACVARAAAAIAAGG